MTLWVVRSGRMGEREALALANNIVAVGWEALGESLEAVRDDRAALATRLQSTYADENPKAVQNWKSQLWPFIAEQGGMVPGDLVGMPGKGKSTIEIGEIAGPYTFRPDLPAGSRHTRPVRWLGQILRGALDMELRYSFGGAMTIFRINRPDAEARVRKLVGQPPGAVLVTTNGPTSVASAASDTEVAHDFAEMARDSIRTYIGRKFKGHGLTGLVAAVLQTQGYTVKIAPEGADKGVDIIAGKGPLGFEQPRLAVQVKSGDGPVDAMTVQQLQGAMAMVKAQHGLFVAWGGYKSSLNWMATVTSHFDIRLWTDVDLIAALQASYDLLPAEIQAELPLQRIWTLVPVEDD